MKRLLLQIYQFFSRHTTVLRVVLLTLIVALSCSLFRIHFVEDISTFIPQKGENQRANYAFQHMGAANKIMVSITASDSTQTDLYTLTSAADSLAQTLTAIDTSSRITSIFYRLDEYDMFALTQFFVQNMPYYLDSADYHRIESLITPLAIDSALATSRQILASPIGGVAKQLVAIDPLMFSAPILNQLSSVQQPENYQLIDNYLFSKDSTEAVMIIESAFPISETSQNARLIQDIQKATQQVEHTFQQTIHIDYIGASVISVENASRIKKDTILSTLIALVGILIILFFFFRDVRALLILLFSISFGGLFALAFLALFKGSVSIIAIGIGSIMVGIAANYPIHYLAHYQQGYSPQQTLKDISTPLITGNITTVGAFLSLVFISSPAMKDLGLFASMLLVGTILFVVLFLPHLFSKSLFRNQSRNPNRLMFAPIAHFRIDSHRWIVLLVLFLTIPLFLLSRRPAFESDMSTINYMTPDQRVKMQHMVTALEPKNPILFCATEAPQLEQALQHYEYLSPIIDSLQQQGAIYKSAGIQNFLPSQSLQQHRLQLWHQFWQSHQSQFIADLQSAAQRNGYRPEAFNPFIEWLQQPLQPQSIEHFQPVLNALASNWLSLSDDKNLVITQLEIPASQQTHVAQILNQLHPDIYTFSNQSLLSQMIQNLSDDFDWVLYVCGLIVLLFLTFSFGRIELSLITFIPLLIGWIWILGIMGLFNIKFNIVNIILATFIFGMGDDYSIFVTEGMIYEHTYRKRMLASYKNSVFLSATIMFIGIGALIFAKHPAMQSLAQVTIIGMSSVVLMAYLFPPLLYRWLTTKKGAPRPYPITLFNLFKTALSMLVFIIIATLLTPLGFILSITHSKRAKYHYHCCIAWVMRFCIKLLPQVHYHLNNPLNESFNKPAIIISNHQSQLDLLYLLALNPKIICLTNQWVWNCPFYKHIIRFADYYPIIDHLENSKPLLQQAINDGYSILVFPEGTRSVDGSIGRFHKGAFYIAEQLHLDILPIMLHGVGHIFPKHEFLLRKGTVTLSILPRIAPDDAITYQQRASQCRKAYQQHYHQLALQLETSNYYADLVRHNYLYKGKSIEQQVRQSLRHHHNYQTQIAQLPNQGEVHISDPSLGEYPLLAALVKKDLHIIAHYTNSDHYQIAINCPSIPKNLTHMLQSSSDNSQ